MILRIVLTVLLVSSVGYSKTLIVSDIDDTVKISHIRDKADMAWYAFVTTSEFEGMSELYSAFIDENKNSSIIYVTNANEFLMGTSHRKFLSTNEFPEGEIFFKKSGDDDHKYTTIKNYVETNGIEKLILIGDNGQEDIDFYSRVHKEFSDRIFIKTYIRILYSDSLPLEKFQMGFVTPLEILADFRINDFVSLEAYKTLSTKLSEEILSEENPDRKSPHYFPKWLDCRNHQAAIEAPLMTAEVQAAMERVSAVCN